MDMLNFMIFYACYWQKIHAQIHHGTLKMVSPAWHCQMCILMALSQTGLPAKSRASSYFLSMKTAKGSLSDIPSGKLTNSYGKSQVLMGKYTINGPFSIANCQITRGYQSPVHEVRNTPEMHLATPVKLWAMDGLWDNWRAKAWWSAKGVKYLRMAKLCFINHGFFTGMNQLTNSMACLSGGMSRHYP